jgi:hypothetical protein
MENIGRIEMIFSFSIPLGWAAWELYVIRRDRARARKDQ